MDPIIDNDWLGFKNEPVDDQQQVGNVAQSWQCRETGVNPSHCPPNKTVLENIAEDILVQKPLNIRSCDLPGYPRSTFLMVFSPDGTKVASTHGNHNVYVSELASGKHVRILKGHPRTPWCIAFHPSHPQLIGSGCLGGQVRVWDLSGGSEVWTVENETVIASIAFHPRDQLLVIATYNELYFWDWSQPTPLTKVCTNNLNEKVRYVAFDSLGYKLITGISVWNGPGSLHHSLMQTVNQGSNANNSNQATSRRDSPSDSPGAANRNQDSNGSASQEMIVNSYQNLVQRYDSLVRNYQRLFMARHQLSNTTNTTDRGTDPMETDAAAATAGTSGWTPRPTRASSFRDFADDDNDAPPAATASVSGRTPRLSRITGFRDHADDEFDTPPPDYAAISGWTPLPTRASGFRGRAEQESSSRNDGPDSGDGEGSSSRLLNLDVLSINSDPSRSTDSNNGSSQERSVFGSRTSAFQRLNDHPERRSSDASERSTRLLPNPFSTTSNPISRSSRITFGSNAQQPTDNAGSSRTSVFTSHRLDSPSARYFMQRRRNALSPAQNHTTTSTNTSPPMRSSRNADGSNGDQLPSTSETPPLSPVAAQTINESLDLIRDILRDSGTRLLNLITNMSMTTLESVERSIPRRRHASLTRSDDGDAPARPRSQRPRARRIEVRRELLLTSESESDSDQSLEVNIFRTRNSSFQETATTAPEPSVETMHPTNRMVVELNVNDDDLDEDRLIPNDGFNISLERRFRVRSHSSSENAVRENGSGDGPSTSQTDYNRAFNEPLNLDPNRPSTSRDNYLMDDPLSLAADPNRPRIPPDEAFRKVRTGVNALHRHTGQLTDMWVHGSQTSMTDLRKMWENLRRRVLALHRQTSRQDAPSYYRSGLLERCRFLTEMSRGTRSTRNAAAGRTRRAEQNQNQDSFSTDNAQTQMSTDSTSSSVPTENEPSTSAGASAANRTRQSRRATQSKWRNSPPTRRRLQSSYRWRPEDEMRRRLRNGASIHHSNMRNRRGHRDTRSFELLCTRNEIRMRAMQVLSIMFNMMMNCLEERGLSQLIIHMLKTLKKALALTCLMLMTNRMNRREPARNTESTTANENDLTTPEATAESTQSEMETQEGRTSATDNPEGHHDTNSTSSWPTSDSDDDQDKKNKKKKDPKKGDGKTDTRASSSQNMVTANPNTRPEPLPSTSQRWSNRLAVQISVANRNDSSTARNRRELYNEAKRLKALHRTNPNVHPISKRKVLPPVSTSRIPSLRRLPPKKKAPKSVKSTAQNTSDEPVAGPSNSQPGPSSDGNSSRDTPRSESMNEFEHRVNLFRIAHMHAVRLRNAARNRFRRLQTIRLYTPSSVREMFTLQSNNNDSPSGSQSPLNNASEMGRRPFTAYRPHILTTRNELGNREAGRQFDSILNNVAVPLVQVNDMPVTENQGPQPQRLPRVHEYLQPIILAQNALVVEEGGGGAGVGGGVMGGGVMGGLLDAAFVSEALPAPTHRVQAWDFTTGVTPDIADATKNVVVQRCRIHNDASIDISKDGRLLVALLPVQRLRNTTHWLGVYSLEWDRLGQCLHTAVLEQSAVSVALSPTARHLAVGLGSRRFTTLPHARNNVFALLYRLSPRESSSRTGLSPIKELEQNWEQGFTSLNCLRWAPQPGQGLVYANNTGQLIIMS